MTLTEIRRLQKDMYAFCAGTMFWAAWLVCQCTLWRSYIQYSPLESTDAFILVLSLVMTGITLQNAVKASSRQNSLSVNHSTIQRCSFYATSICLMSSLLIVAAYVMHRGDFPDQSQNFKELYHAKSHLYGTIINYNMTVNATRLAYSLPRMLFWDGYLLGCAFWLLMAITTIVFQNDYKTAGSIFLNSANFYDPAG